MGGGSILGSMRHGRRGNWRLRGPRRSGGREQDCCDGVAGSRIELGLCESTSHPRRPRETPPSKARRIARTPCAHLYETGGLRRAHVRGHENVLKRLLVHAGAFNLGLWTRTLCGVGTPRGLQGRLVSLGALLSALWSVTCEAIALIGSQKDRPARSGRLANASIAGD